MASSSDLLASLEEAHQEVGRLKQALAERDEEVSELQDIVSLSSQSISGLEEKLKEQNQVVSKVLGFNLDKISPVGNRGEFTAKSILMFEVAVKPRITNLVSSLSVDSILELQADDIVKVIPGYRPGKSASEQSEEFKKAIIYALDEIKGFVST